MMAGGQELDALGEELAAFRERMPADAYQQSKRACVDRLVRESLRLPVVATNGVRYDHVTVEFDRGDDGVGRPGIGDRHARLEETRCTLGEVARAPALLMAHEAPGAQRRPGDHRDLERVEVREGEADREDGEAERRDGDEEGEQHQEEGVSRADAPTDAGAAGHGVREGRMVPRVPGDGKQGGCQWG